MTTNGDLAQNHYQVNNKTKSNMDTEHEGIPVGSIGKVEYVWTSRSIHHLTFFLFLLPLLFSGEWCP